MSDQERAGEHDYGFGAHGTGEDAMGPAEHLVGEEHMELSRAAADPIRTDFIDYPTGWRIQREAPGLEHHPDCSALVGGFLCDCAAMPVEWARRAIEQEPHREAEIRAALQQYLPEHMRTPT